MSQSHITIGDKNIAIIGLVIRWGSVELQHQTGGGVYGPSLIIHIRSAVAGLTHFVVITVLDT